MEEIGIAARAEDVPGQGGGAERNDRHGMKQTNRIAPALRAERPKKYSAAGEDDRGWAFCENGKAEKKSEEDQLDPRSAWNNRRIFVAG